jgi:hypothetical protein
MSSVFSRVSWVRQPVQRSSSPRYLYPRRMTARHALTVNSAPSKSKPSCIFLLARLAIRSRLFPVGPNRRLLGQPVIFSRKIGQQNGCVAARHRDRQRPHLCGTVTPVLRIVGFAWGHLEPCLRFIMELEGTFARAPMRLALDESATYHVHGSFMRV